MDPDKNKREKSSSDAVCTAMLCKGLAMTNLWPAVIHYLQQKKEKN